MNQLILANLNFSINKPFMVVINTVLHRDPQNRPNPLQRQKEQTINFDHQF